MSVDTAKRIENLIFEINCSGHRIRADVSEKLGGTNQGPEPHDYLEAALAACTVITMQIYADQNGIPLESSDVQIRILSEGDTNQIHREIMLVGELLTDEQREELLVIAEKCPIHNFLTRGAKIHTHLAHPELHIGL